MILITQSLLPVIIFQVPFQPTSTDRGRPIVMQPYQQAIAIDVDCSDSRVYWSDITEGNIYSSDFTGQDIKTFIGKGKKILIPTIVQRSLLNSCVSWMPWTSIVPKQHQIGCRIQKEMLTSMKMLGKGYEAWKKWLTCFRLTFTSPHRFCFDARKYTSIMDGTT